MKALKTLAKIFVIIVLALPAFSQVAINSTGSAPDASAMLDIAATNKGILIPRVTINNLTDNTSPVNSPTTGLMVYSNGGSVPDGFYYWNGSS